ncbi:hypothetical protein V8E53_001273 [Lactarius tabidus]|jgi:hypothetical protein
MKASRSLESAESVVLASLLITVRLCLDITLGSQDSGERKDGDNTWSLWDGAAKVDEVGESFQMISVVGLMDEEQAVLKRRSQSLAR